MTDYENKDLNGQPSGPASPETARPTPNLTLEPDPVPPVDPMPEAGVPAPSAASFQMPDPPKAPEPPREEPAYQQAPNYTAPPQYTAPQYTNPGYQQPQQPGYYQQPQKPRYNVPPAGYIQKSRLAAGLLAILVGCLGIHNYYLGYNTRGTIQLVVTLAGGLLTCGVASMAMVVWGFIEGVQILGASSPDRMYDGNNVILKD